MHLENRNAGACRFQLLFCICLYLRQFLFSFQHRFFRFLLCGFMRFNGCLCLFCLFLRFLCILLGFIQLLLHGFFCLLIGGVFRFSADFFQFGFVRKCCLLCLHPQLIHFTLHGGNPLLRFSLGLLRRLLLVNQCFQLILCLLIGGIHSVILFRPEQIQLRL